MKCQTCEDNQGQDIFSVCYKLDCPYSDGKKQEQSKYEKLGKELGQLCDKKQKSYGNSFESSQEFLKILYPGGIEPKDYQDVLTLARIFDKCMRIANDKDAFGESPYKDIVGYGLLGAMLDKKRKGEGNNE